ncbi:unnamed protein product [Blepharisma stoltei]|uniref:Photosystem I assembly protein Ycf4 n=1 Tax=Blepharisma stoltei TaxID=1481888 RepID=A0AAU9IW91_9CILI|nr:unnamed protein product [Blepharisma stoltei]
MMRISQCIIRSAGTFVPKQASYFADDGKLLIYSSNLGSSFKYFFIGGMMGSVGSISYYQLIYPSYASLALFGFSLLFSQKAWESAYLMIEELNLLIDGKTIEIKTYGFRKQYQTLTIPISEIVGSKGVSQFYIKHNKYQYILERSGIIFQEELLSAVLRGLEIDNAQFIKEV